MLKYCNTRKEYCYEKDGKYYYSRDRIALGKLVSAAKKDPGQVKYYLNSKVRMLDEKPNVSVDKKKEEPKKEGSRGKKKKEKAKEKAEPKPEEPKE